MRGSGTRLATFGTAMVCSALLLSVDVSTAATNFPPKAPGVATGDVLEVGGTTVVLQGWVAPRGQKTDYHYELGTTTSYGISPELSDEEAVRGFGWVNVLEAIPKLRPRTIYHFRLVAHSRGGTTYGKDKTFRTLGPGAP